MNSFLLIFRFFGFGLFLLNNDCSVDKSKILNGNNCDSLISTFSQIILQSDYAETKRVDIYDKVIEEDVRKIYRWGASILEGYYKNKDLLFIKVIHEGDRENLISIYIYSNKNLLVKKERITFDPPKWEENSAIKKRVEQYVLVENGKLAKWCKEGMIVNNEEYEFQSQFFIREFTAYKDLFNK